MYNEIKVEGVNRFDKIFIITILIMTIPIELGFRIIDDFHKIPSIIYYLPLLVLVVYFFLLLLSKNIIYQSRLTYLYVLPAIIIAHILVAYALAYVAGIVDNSVGIIIYLVMGLFYTAFLWDFFTSISSFRNHIEDYTKSLDEAIKQGPIDSKVFQITAVKFITLRTQKQKSILGYMMLIFSLPFVFLGKTASYFLAVEGGSHFNALGYMIATIIFPVTLFFILKLTFVFIALWKLKYPIRKV